ncbi:MAG TPA: T9SS type A sorting domain-containing protein, partial [Bacteroidia bacterium]|nr:T9SS type A sorting domain-containing protein [Bacteroidia bacterium]
GFRNAFLVKFNSLGQRKWGTFYGTNQELGNGCSTDAMGNVFMAGETNGFTNVLATTGNHQVTYGGGGFDAYLVKFDSSGVRQWGTFYGGSGVDTGNECDVDASGNVFVPGQTTTTLSTVIATATGHQTVYIGSNENAFLVKFEDCLVPASPVNTTPVANQTLCANTSASLTASGTGTINWFSSATSSVVLGSGNTFITPTLSAGNYTYYADVITCAYSGTRTAITVSVFPAPALTVSTSNSLICVGQTASLTANGANIYTWSTTSSGSMIPVSPTITTTYSVTGIDVNGCSGSISITQSVSTCAGFNEFSDNAEIKVFPNPSEGKFLLQLNLNDHTVLIEILDVAGKRLRYFVAKSNETLIDLTEFRSGIYFLRVNNYKPIKISKQ